MVLESSVAGKPVRTPVEILPGNYAAPTPGLIRERVTLRPGPLLKSAARPPERLVRFYRGATAERTLVVAVVVRYDEKTPGAWGAAFRLVEEPLVVPTPQGPRPFTGPAGAEGLIVTIGSTLPNADGYFPTLEFGLTSGTLQIDSWVVE
jgi:hypothetical protein